MDAPLLIDVSDGVVVASINRGTKGNSLNQSVIDALDDLAGRIEADHVGPRELRALVITGTGSRAFSAGADITELAGIEPEAAYQQMRRGQLVFDRIENLPVPVIAAINGFAVGGGLELAMAADIRIAATTARMGQAEINLGNLPGWGGTQRLPLLVGVGRAKELIMTGDLVEATTAHSYGLVNSVAENCLADAMALARRLAEKAPVALAGAKAAIAAGIRQGIDVGLDVEARKVADCCATEEQRAATAAFLNR